MKLNSGWRNSMNSRKPRLSPENCTSICSAPKPLSVAAWQKEQEADRKRTMQQVGASLNVLAPQIVVLVEQLQGLIYQAMAANGFHEGVPFATKIALIHSELSEALEADRKQIVNDDKIPEFTGIEAELADTVIRILDLAGSCDQRLGEAIVAKMLYNLNRPFKHGKQY